MSIKNKLWFLVLLAAPDLLAHNNQIEIQVSNGQRCFVGNGLPDHDTGSFPNRGNPNSISAQNIHLCVPEKPSKNSRPEQVRGSVGVALNGIQIRPGTAEYYDQDARHGVSRDRSSGWNLEGMGAADQLGMDQNNAHVDNRGLYHYHGVPGEYVQKQSKHGSLIGYAADGFEIHYFSNGQSGQKSSSYQLKSGLRSNPPGGEYDGTYVQDWQFIKGSGSLDECNGRLLEGRYVYFATDTYPFFPRCLWGEISQDFVPTRGQGGEGQRGRNYRGEGRRGQRPPHGHPPPHHRHY